jgi:AcrR family transcriptional regulator
MSKTSTRQRSAAAQRILEVASNLFYRRGYRATGINEVIDTSDVAKATFYNHFPSKDDLALAYIEQARVAELEYMESCIAAEEDPVRRLLTVIESLDPWLQSTDFRGCPFINLASEVPDAASPLRQAGIKVYDAVRNRVRELSADLIASDRQRYGHLEPGRLADEYLLLFTGAIALAEIYHALWPVEHALAGARRLIGH